MGFLVKSFSVPVDVSEIRFSLPDDKHFFAGFFSSDPTYVPDVEKPIHNADALRAHLFKVAGKVVASSIVNGCPGFPYFPPAAYTYT
jgi:hypothetical protein